MERYWSNFRFLSDRKWISRQGFCDCFGTASRRWTRTSFYTAVISDEGPATGINSVSVADFRFISVLTAILQVNLVSRCLLKQRMMEVVVTAGLEL